MPRYTGTQIFTNTEEFYEFLRKKRNSPKAIRMYETQRLYNPTVGERANLATINHLWKLGDRFYKLAAKYYGNSQYWWVIAQYNGMPTEADVVPGDVITIPTNLEEALTTLRAV